MLEDLVPKFSEGMDQFRNYGSSGSQSTNDKNAIEFIKKRTVLLDSSVVMNNFAGKNSGFEHTKAQREIYANQVVKFIKRHQRNAENPIVNKMESATTIQQQNRMACWAKI